MGKNVYAAPRKGPAGKWVEQTAGKAYAPDKQQAQKERLQKLANKYKQQQDQ